MADENNQYPTGTKGFEYYILGLAEGPHPDREGLVADDVMQQAKDYLRGLEQQLAVLHALTYLEAKVRCDEYIVGKNKMVDLGETYGYLNSRVEMNKGTIDMYFQSKRPGGDGYFRRFRIAKAKKTGYASGRLRRYAAHESEAELANATEAHYKRLRDQADKIKKAMRAVRDLELYKMKG